METKMFLGPLLWITVFILPYKLGLPALTASADTNIFASSQKNIYFTYMRAWRSSKVVAL
jgi:hypothetical protein